MPGELTVGELLGLYASYYPHASSVEETLELVGLAEQRRGPRASASRAASSAALTSGWP